MNNQVRVFDDCLLPMMQNELETVFFSEEIPYRFGMFTAYPHGQGSFWDANTVDYPQFAHPVVFDRKVVSNYWPAVSPILYHITSLTGVKIVGLVRVKVNMNTPHPGFKKGMYKPAHIDSDEPNTLSILYYVNDADGDTLFFSAPKEGQALSITQRVAPKKGRAVVFSSDQFHAPELPIESSARCTISFIVEVAA